jgi:hypothetical protein
VHTSYPWDERITVTVVEAGSGPWTLALRVPQWCRDARLTVNGSLVRAGAQEGYLRVSRAWRAGDRVELTLAMPPRLVEAHPRVDAVRGSAALARGPVVYCLEHADLPRGLSGVLFEDLELDPTVPLEIAPPGHRLAPVALRVPVRVRPEGPGELYRPQDPAVSMPVPGPTDGLENPGPGWKVTATVPAIPYFLWANRAAGPMRVWIPMAPREA